MTAAGDPHRILGLEPGASQAEIKRAYRRLAKVLHPDSAGERSLPAFLAVQEAYERLTGTRVRTVRAPGAGNPPAGARGTGATGGFREPWRADPARARAAREQARTRRAPGADGSASTGSGPTGASSASSRRTRSSSSARGTGDPGAAAPGASQNGAGAAARAAGSAGAGDLGGRRRRPTRKATMGSTSYDEARDAADPRWAGASWYGPTTGEYWIVNPREYADPRKHGPGYSNRVRSGDDIPAAAAPLEPDLASDAPADPIAGAMPQPEPARSQAAPRNPAASPRARPAPSGSHPTDEWPEPPPRASASAGEAAVRSGGAAAPVHDEPFLDALLRPGSRDPLRRIGLVLLAWAPVGIAAAGVIGQVTGCGSYSASCDGTDPYLPWVAQAIILGLLLLIPLLARVFATGTLGLLVGLIPATGLVIALGGARSNAAPPVLGAVLAISWLIGLGWGIRRLVLQPRGRP